jgi:hypothetical protein
MNGILVVTLLQSDSDGLTLGEIIESLPTDPTSLFATALVVGFFGLIVYFGRRQNPGSTDHPGTPDVPPRDEQVLTGTDQDPGP